MQAATAASRLARTYTSPVPSPTTRSARTSEPHATPAPSSFADTSESAAPRASGRRQQMYSEKPPGAAHTSTKPGGALARGTSPKTASRFASLSAERHTKGPRPSASQGFAHARAALTRPGSCSPNEWRAASRARSPSSSAGSSGSQQPASVRATSSTSAAPDAAGPFANGSSSVPSWSCCAGASFGSAMSERALCVAVSLRYAAAATVSYN
mmetsp:Transcript_19441/g.57825  ORF Transcript_19441/g.57825 Transcript_19441/m.57825 type:complete len:212 (+) Transcript_19441:435-1070(+)